MASVAPAPPLAARDRTHSDSPPRARLRIGVAADGARQPRWIVEALAKVAASGFAEIAALSVESAAPPRDAATTSPLWSAYSRVDRAIFGGATDWTAPVDIESLVPPARRKSLAEAAPLDVIFAIGAVDDGALEGLARQGVWRYCFGEGHGACEPLAGIREVVDAIPVTVSGLRVRVGAGRPDRIAYRSWSRTQTISVAKSRGNVFAKASEFLARALAELHAAGPGWLERRELAPGPASQQAAGGARDLATMAGRLARRTAQKLLGVEQWSLAFRFTDIEPWNAEKIGALDGFFRLDPPRDRFWADPFPIQRHGKSYVFFEELEFAAGKAHISVVEVDREGRASKPVRVLERDYHLSYPFLLEERGELYMIPETAQNHTVEIYRCVDFPRKWRLERVLLRGVHAADATLHREAGRWWMFANCASGFEMHDELHLFGAETLMGEWKPHRCNPVKSDVRSARPAGRLFSQGGRLYRPSQICAPLYGSGVAINRVTRLDAEAFTEETERRIVPAAGSSILGLHTINRAGDLSVIDAFARRPRF
ncbi:MAG: glucosamine inositolphosphorylceramide transferase family protein [Usitatibacter sp.]